MYERHTKFSIEEVFSAIRENREIIINDRPMQYSVRLLTYFVHGTDCVCDECPVKGSFFAAERQINSRTGKPNTEGYHLNFYGYDAEGNEMMMTSDHKIPKSRGGSKNALDNRQPMCYLHNMQKGDQMIYT